MSRIDEAMRRAVLNLQKDDLPQDAPEETSDAAFDDPEVGDLAAEPFPIEMGARPAPHARFGKPAQAASAETGDQAHAQATPFASGSAPKMPGDDAVDTLFERIDNSFAEKVVADKNMSAVSREQYRRLAAVLHDAQLNTGLNVIMIASAVSGEGKTLTASNLALTLSESYHKRVLLIDADLRKPTLHQIFKIDSALGLTAGLTAGQETKLTVHQVSSRLSVLPAGRPTTDPMAGLVSDRMRRLIAEAKTVFDWVILDTPPVVLLPDANLLSAMVQGTVLVIRANSTPHDLVKRAANAIGVPRIIGTVLNQATEAIGAHYGSYYYYGSGQRYLNVKEAVKQA